MARRSNLLTGFGLLAVLLLLLNLPTPVSRTIQAGVREALAPLHGLVSGTVLRIREAATTLRGLGGLARENREMAAELLRLRDEVQALRGFERENRELRDLLGFARASPRRLIPSEVIARDVSGWWQTLRIGVGRRDGVRENLAVLTADGLAGRTWDASATTAEVLLISDPTCRVSARLPRSGELGVVSGRGIGRGGRVRLRMEFVSRHASIEAGDEVVTSGLGGVFPPGIPIGRIESTSPDDLGLYQEAVVVPHADIARLRHVFVVAGDVEDLPFPSPVSGMPPEGGTP